MEKYENIQKEAPDRAYEMDSYLIDTVLTYIDDQDKQSLITLLNEYHPADIADLFEQIFCVFHRFSNGGISSSNKPYHTSMRHSIGWGNL